MVRLLPCGFGEFIAELATFQSHNGAIAAARPNMVVCDPFWFQSHNGAIAACFANGQPFGGHQFQSHNGAIAAVLVAQWEHEIGLVSIPQWCDCCWDDFPNQPSTFVFQSHNGAIAASGYWNDPTIWDRFQSHNGAIAALVLH